MRAPLRTWLQQGDRRLPLAAALIVLLGTAVVHGLWTDRWSSGQDLEAALARMDQVPLVSPGWFGDERGLEEAQEDAARRVGIARILRRQFTRTADGQSVSIILMGGRFGPLSVHTPDVCYGGVGYVMMGKPSRLEIGCADGSTAVFWTARFHKPQTPETPPLRIFWAWNASNGWQAPDNPRFAFRMKPALFKLYAVREMTSANDPLDQDAVTALLERWLPEVNRSLF